MSGCHLRRDSVPGGCHARLEENHVSGSGTHTAPRDPAAGHSRSRTKEPAQTVTRRCRPSCCQTTRPLHAGRGVMWANDPRSKARSRTRSGRYAALFLNPVWACGKGLKFSKSVEKR
ncbi:hypothetical protein VNO78_27197 [Psophocarpus tetragonolobus]|uniref:Uncharacterized protein n=1 Tax=Psophocarpus tetragonolobus TaxID=3891 RepID=A0AAN9S314_PSOTE